MAASIVEVAQAAGVSHSTVSRVINNRPGVSSESARRVLEAIKALGYEHRERRPGPKPKERRQVGTAKFGLVLIGEEVNFNSSPVAASVFHTVESELTALDYELTVCRIGGSNRLPPSIENASTAGLLLYGKLPSPTLAKSLRIRPSVWLLSEREGTGYWGDRVGPDNQAIGVAAAEYLAGLGHKRVAMVELLGMHVGFHDRAASFRDTAASLDMTLETIKAHETEVEQVVAKLSKLSPEPQGLFIPRDRLTARVMRGLGLACPKLADKVDVVSCDNDPVLDGLPKRPATFDIRPDLIGKRAVKQLLWRVDHAASGTRSIQTVEPRLVPADRVQ